MIESIQHRDMTSVHPIVVKKDFDILWIINGQTRFAACKALNKPIYYILAPDWVDKENDIAFCQEQRKWEAPDHLRFWSNGNDGRESYVFVNEIVEQYKLMKYIGMIVTLCSDDKGAMKKWSKGNFRITKNKDLLKKYFYEMNEMKKFIQTKFTKIKITKNNMVGLFRLTTNKWFDLEHMIAKMGKNLDDVLTGMECKSVKNCYEKLVEIWNTKKGRNRVDVDKDESPEEHYYTTIY